MEKRKGIRIVTTDIRLVEKVDKLAKENRRTLGKQAEYMVAEYIKEHKL